MTTVRFSTFKATYEYQAYSFNTNFNSVAGNYIFAYQNAFGTWVPLYVGQTNNFAARFSNHEKIAEARRKGATYILAHTNLNEVARKSEEADLINSFKPVCNDLLK